MSPFPFLIRPGSFLERAELIDFHLALREHGFNLELASHDTNHGLQSTDAHIGRWPIQAVLWLEWGTSPAGGCPSIHPDGFLELSELIDPRPALREHGFNLQLASHGPNHGLQSTDVHIGAALPESIPRLLRS